jgi:hypothetical protein
MPHKTQQDQPATNCVHTMVLSCRHCYSPGEMNFLEDQQAPHQASYASFFVHGGHETLLKTMEWVESQRPIPSITVWYVRLLIPQIPAHVIPT